MSHNPFRKARDQQIELPTADAASIAGIFDYREPTRQEQADQQVQRPQTTKSGKPKKKVVIKTPPRSPEEPQRRLSLGRPPSPVPEGEGVGLGRYGDAQDDITAADASLQEAMYNARRNSADTNSTYPGEPVAVGASDELRSDNPSQTQAGSGTGSMGTRAPANPFARTMAMSEEKYGAETGTQDDAAASKPAFDIDTFKNILMNGAAPPPRPQAGSASGTKSGTELDDEAALSDRFPSLDASAPSRRPEGAIIIEDDDDTSSEDSGDEVASAPIEPQISTGPQIVAFDELASPSPSMSAARTAQTAQPLQEKALPALPVADSKPSVPPPPPASRRQAHQTPTEGRRRSSSIMSKSSMQSDTSSIVQPAAAADNVRAPPPPPSRRSLNSKTPPAASPDNETVPAVPERSNMPPPPTPASRRAPSKAVRGDSRPSPGPSRTSLSAVTEASSPGAIPPRPPPRRAGESNRSSVDGSLSVTRRSSGQDSTRPSNDLETPEPRSQADLLSDLAALQREVDALRARAGAG